MAEQPTDRRPGRAGSSLKAHSGWRGGRRRWPGPGSGLARAPGSQGHHGLAQRLHLRLRPAPGGRAEEALRGGGASRRRTSSCPGAAPRSCRRWRPDRSMFALGDSNHPLKITEKGKDALMVFATDTRCSYANIVVRKELWDKGVKTRGGPRRPEAGRAQGGGRGHRDRLRHLRLRRVRAAEHSRAADGKPVNDHVEWVGGGASTTMLGGLKAGKFDAIMAVPEWQAAAVEEGFGKPHLRHPGREGVEPRLRRAHPGHGGLRA